jgi:hypothetical protein
LLDILFARETLAAVSRVDRHCWGPNFQRQLIRVIVIVLILFPGLSFSGQVGVALESVSIVWNLYAAQTAMWGPDLSAGRQLHWEAQGREIEAVPMWKTSSNKLPVYSFSPRTAKSSLNSTWLGLGPFQQENYFFHFIDVVYRVKIQK